MQASRLLAILMTLQTRGRTSAQALAEALEVSTRTILRDMDQLSAAGVPVHAERGQQGGFQLRDGWQTSLTGLTRDEAHALALAGLPTAATDLGLSEAAMGARLKVMASLPSAWRAQAANVAARLHVDPVDWYRASESPLLLQPVAHAVWNAERIDVRYQSWERLQDKRLEPLGLVFKAGTWYLVARREGATRTTTYRVANIQAVKTTGRSFTRPRGFDLALAWQASMDRFERQRFVLQARLLLSPRALGWLANARTPVQDRGAAANATLQASGWREVALAIESIEHGGRQVLGMTPEVRVLGPQELRQWLDGTAKAWDAETS
jgi:predicted DNA-binding transcriptional regulator YafY